jgi:purine-cytosine permease-like protein
VGSDVQIAANRLSFFSLCFYVPNSWAGAASDYYVYYPENTPKWKAFVLTYTGLTLSFTLVDMLGVGLASGVATNPVWTSAYSTSIGALITSAFSPLGRFGSFCATIICLGLIANSVPGTYSAALNCQTLGRVGLRVPRWIWTIAIVVVELVCALAGRDKVFIVFQNVLALMGYWLMIMICIVAEEHVLFRWKRGITFDWSAWDDRRKLPLGIAAFISFGMGWVGAVLGMYQVWYVGPLAKLVGDTGADIGMWLGCGVALVVFPPTRFLELKVIGR